MSLGAELPPELDRLAEEFVARERKGERPTISEYVHRYPEFASGIREVFPLLAVFEGVQASAGVSRRAQALNPIIESLGDYRLLRVIGRGGMGVVYEAEQGALGRRVALKVLPPSAMLDPRFVERFRIEAQAAARLQHPHIVPVIGLGEDGGVHYYAMQFIQGQGLDEVLADTRVLLRDPLGAAPASGSGVAAALFTRDLTDGSTSQSAGAIEEQAGFAGLDPSARSGRVRRRRYHRNVARIGLQAADALAYAHANGVLHRDIKPSNIMLDERGHAWIADFGLCRADEDGNLTRTGDLVGTLRYMAPECFRDVYDVRGDVYGLGLTLYELLTGAPAFEGKNRAELVRQVVNESPPRLRAQDASIPEDLATIVHKAIVPDPEVRYPTAEALASDLRAFLDGRPISARAPSALYLWRSAVRRNRPLAITVVVATLLLVAGAAAYVVNTKTKEARAREEHYAANVAAAETALRDGDLPSARRLLARAPEEFRDWEWLHLASRLDPGLRTFKSLSPDVARTLAHSPDGRWLAIGGDRSLFVCDQESEDRVEIEIAWARSLAWSPKGDRIAIGTIREVILLAWPGGREIARHAWSDYASAVQYDRTGERVFVGSSDCHVHELEAESLERVRDVAVPSKVLSLALSPDGTRLAVGRLDGVLMMMDVGTLEVRWAQAVSPRALLGLTFMGDELVAGTAYDGALRVLDSHDGSLVRVLAHERFLWDVAASPDGRLLATLENGGRLHIWDPRSGRKLEPRTHGREVSTLSFRPDGLGVVTASWSGTVTEWGVFSEHDSHILGGHLDGVLSVSIHPNGRIATSGSVGGILRLWDLDTGELIRAYPGHGGWIVATAFSPNGKHVASGSRDSKIFVRRISDGAIVAKMLGHTRTVRAISYSRNGAHIFSAGSDGAFCVWDAVTGQLLHRAELSIDRLVAVATSSDGRLIAVGGAESKVYVVDAESWRVRATLLGHERGVLSLTFDPRSHTLASGAVDQTIRLWNPRTGELIRTLSTTNEDLGKHTDVIDTLAFHPGGSRLMSGSRDGSISVWDWSRGQPLSTLRGHLGWVHEIAFSADGARLVSCSSDRTVRVWDTRFAAERAPAQREARRRRELARPILDAAYERAGGDLDVAIRAIEADGTLPPDQQEAALRLAHRRWCTRPELKKWMWRVLTPDEVEADAMNTARCVALGFVRVSLQRGRQDAEGHLLAGIADYRAGAEVAGYYLRRSIQMHDESPELRAIGWAFLTLFHASRDRHEQARESLGELDALFVQDPSARTDRAERFAAQARAASTK